MSAEDAVSVNDLKARPAFDSVLVDLSSRFVNVAADNVDREIGDALRRVCELLDIDFAALWQWSDDSHDLVVPTHTYPPQLDASGLESLEAINHRLKDGGITFHLSEVKGPVLDRLKRSHFLGELTGKVHLSQYEAVASIDPELARRAREAERVDVAAL